MIRILHLTDFHLNHKTLKDWNDFLKDSFFKKIDDLQKDKTIDLVLFTGDLIDQAGKDFGSVKQGLKEFESEIISPILTQLDLDISRFIICPGNHDINRNADKPFHEIGLKGELVSIDKINSFTNQKEDDYDGIQRIKEYKEFEFDLYKDVNEKLHAKFRFSLRSDINGQSIGISSLNSAWRCYDNNDKNNIFLGENQLNDNFKYIQECDIKIALIHHQLDWLSEIESETIKNHISSNYDLIFSGHVHQSEVEYVQNTSGKSLRIVSPSGLNQIRQNDNDYSNGFSLIDYGENVKCHFFKYNHRSKVFVDNTDVCDKGVFEINLKSMTHKTQSDSIIPLLEDDFNGFLEDSGANFTHRSKTLNLDDIYVSPFMEQFSLIDKEERSLSARSEDVLQKIINKETDHLIILGEENSGKTSYCKQIFKGCIKEDKTIPVFIKGRDIKGVTESDINNLINKEFKKQYKHSLDLTNYHLVIIIDDFDNARLPLKSKRTFITNLYSLEGQTVITWNEFFTLSELLESQFSSVEIYEILKFGSRKRLELIRKWVDLIDDFEDQQSKEFQIKELFKIVNIVIGKNLIPSLPIYILTILQANELSNSTNFEQSTFGHYYDVLIKSALGQTIKANAEIEKYYSYLSELSFWLFSKGTIDIDESELMEFHRYFIDKYRVQISFRDAISLLEKCNLIEKNTDLYKFKYKYIYFYFIGKYFSDNIEDSNVRDIVTKLSNKLYQTEAANIYIFLSHHSKSKFVINQILARARNLFSDELVIGFNSDITKINNLISETAGKIHFIEEVIIDDENDNEIKNESEIGEDFDNQNNLNESEDIDSISKVNKAFKTIEILSYIIKNRYASLTGLEKIELVEELYKLGLRSLTFIFKTLLDGEDYIKNEIIELIKKDPNSALTVREREEMAKQLMFNLLYMVSYSIFKRISSSLSSKDLEMTFEDVKNKLAKTETGEENNAISLINMAIILEYSKTFPEGNVKALAKKIKNNPLAFHILRRLGVNFMRMIPLKDNEQQKASEILKISVRQQRVIGGTSSIRKK